MSGQEFVPQTLSFRMTSSFEKAKLVVVLKLDPHETGLKIEPQILNSRTMNHVTFFSQEEMKKLAQFALNLEPQEAGQ